MIELLLIVSVVFNLLAVSGRLQSQKNQAFIDILWYCRVMLATKSEKKRQCDDEPTFENGFYNTPSDKVLMLLTSLQLLGLKSVGFNISMIRGASLFAKKALMLVENITPSNPVNRWNSSSLMINIITSNAPIFWTPHIVYYLRQFPRSFDFLSFTIQIKKSSLAKGTPSDTHLEADARWLKIMPRVLFIELYILTLFYVPDSLNSCLESCFESIADGSVGGALLREMIKGAGSAADMIKSPLAVYDCEDTVAGRFDWDKVLNPALRRDVKSRTKELLKTDQAKVVQNTAPPPRFLKRQESRESELKISISSVARDIDGDLVDESVLIKSFDRAFKQQKIYDAYLTIICQIRNRMKGKSMSVISKTRGKDGAESFVGERARGLSIVREVKSLVSAQILTANFGAWNPDKEKDPLVSPLLDGHVMFPKNEKSEDFLRKSIVVCKSSEKPGSFRPDSWEKASIQHEILKVINCVANYQDQSFVFISERDKFGVFQLDKKAKTRLSMDVKTSVNSKHLNFVDKTEVIYEVLKKTSDSIDADSVTFGSPQEIAMKLAVESMTNSEGLDCIAAASSKSRLCREHNPSKSESYGDMLNFRDRISGQEIKEVTVVGRVIKNGGIVMLHVGELYLHLLDTDIKSVIGDEFTIDDFLHCNRPYPDVIGTNASRTKGILEYTLSIVEGSVKISGLMQPRISKVDSISTIEGRKSDAKRRLDDVKRSKNRFGLTL